MEDASLLVDTLHIEAEEFFEDVEFLVEGETGGLGRIRVIQIVADFFEDPGAPEGGTAYHDGIDTVVVESRLGLLCRSDVAIADNGDMDAGVALHLTDEGPISSAGVHLTAGSAVDCQGLDTTVLQLFGERGDDELFVVPA